MTAVAQPELLTREQAAALLGVRVQTLACWAVSGKYDLPFVRIGRCVRYRRADLEAFIERRTVRQPQQPW